MLKEATRPVVAAMRAAIVKCGGAQHFLPNLRRLDITIVGNESGQALFTALAGASALAEVQSLTVAVQRQYRSQTWALPATALRAAIGAGAFSSLRDLVLINMQMPTEALDALVQAMAAAPCARMLERLWLNPCGGDHGAGFTALGVALGQGRFPALRELRLGYGAHSVDAAVSRLVSPLTTATAPALRVLSLEHTDIGDAGVATVAQALKAGLLGSCLRRLRFGDMSEKWGNMTNASARALADTVAVGPQHVTHLEELHLFAPRMTAGGGKTLLLALKAHCPAFKALALSDRVEQTKLIGDLEATARDVGIELELLYQRSDEEYYEKWQEEYDGNYDPPEPDSCEDSWRPRGRLAHAWLLKAAAGGPPAVEQKWQKPTTRRSRGFVLRGRGGPTSHIPQQTTTTFPAALLRARPPLHAQSTDQPGAACRGNRFDQRLSPNPFGRGVRDPTMAAAATRASGTLTPPAAGHAACDPHSAAQAPSRTVRTAQAAAQAPNVPRSSLWRVRDCGGRRFC